MVTVGLINELHFLHEVFGADVSSEIKIGGNFPIKISLQNHTLVVEYKNEKIWTESLDKATSMFGLESCESIMDIVRHIDTGDESWRDKYNTLIS